MKRLPRSNSLLVSCSDCSWSLWDAVPTRMRNPHISPLRDLDGIVNVLAPCTP